jgi:hypothetical protein
MLPKIRLPKFSGEKRVNFGVALLVIVLVTAALLRFVQWVKPDAQLPLLTETSGIVRLTSLEQISSYVQTPVTPPKQLFDANLHVIGVYPTANEIFPQGTVTLVYVREGNRFVELNFRPNTTLEKELAAYADLPKETVALTNDSDATLVRLRDQNYCKNPSEEVVGICQFTRAIVFAYQETVVLLLADGRHATDGQLIEMARSMTRSPNE